MRYDLSPSSLFINNRKKFVEKMQHNYVAVLSSNDVLCTNADDVMGFAQNNDLFYLSGIDQDETILVLYPKAFKIEYQEILFVKEVTEHTALWEGDFLTKEEVRNRSGIKNVKWLHEFETTLQLFAFESDGFYLGHNEHIKRLTKDIETRQDRMIKWVKEKYPLHSLERVSKITRILRPIKSKEEIAQIEKAIEISEKGFMRILKSIKPNFKEYELEAELTYELIKNGGTRHAFKPIVASGKNACVLHYNSNHKTCLDGEMILIDFGVCYANYNSDITRCVPVNGKFSKRQREVYQSVLNCLKKGSSLLKPGVLFQDYERQMAEFVEEELIYLGLLTKEEIEKQDPEAPAYKKYFMHGTAHHLGLDVHDVGLYSEKIKEGMVLTCEPGIYIREEGIGCRLENDYLIVKDGNINLSKSLPIEIDEIERLINSN